MVDVFSQRHKKATDSNRQRCDSAVACSCGAGDCPSGYCIKMTQDERRPRIITPAGYARLREELERLWKQERPRVTQEVSDAAALGDRSENAEYIYGKKRLREIDRRVRYLSKRLDELIIVRYAPEQEGRVCLGAWVNLEDEDGKTHRYRVVGPDELEVRSGRISVEAPLGRALLGKRPGDEILIEAPRGEVGYTIIEISYDRDDGAPRR